MVLALPASVQARYNTLVRSGIPYKIAIELAYAPKRDANGLVTLADLPAVVPGQELAFAEVRSQVNVTWTAQSVAQTVLGQYGMQIVVPPCPRPYVVEASGMVGHSVDGGVVGLRIQEISNGVDTTLMRSVFSPVKGVGTTAPFYGYFNPKLRVPPSVRERQFQLQYFMTTAGTGTVYCPSATNVPNGLAQSAEWPLEIKAVAL